MKILKSIFAIVFVTTFLASCTPTSITEDSNINSLEQYATGDDGADNTDDSRGGND